MMMMMTSLSKQIFRLYVLKKYTKSYVFRIINSEIYNNKYVNVNKLPYINYKRTRSVLSWTEDEFIINKTKKLTSIIIGHGSIIKAEMFNDYERFVPQTLLEFMKIFNNEPQFINNQLKEKLLKTYFFKNNTHYYLASKDEIENFLIVHNGKYLFLTYTQ
jgi:hypothetical protein